jgi:phospholipid/cholesterol/gamma-HCH transport system substrate-binding protein
MRLTRFVKGQVIAFAILALLSGGYTVLTYTSLGARLTGGGYTVTAQFPDVTGLYPRANVTYRGVTVGRVGTFEPGDDGIDVPLDIRSSVEIPRGVVVAVHSTSAIGEQYVDLVPKQGGQRPGVLADGDVIAASDTRGMPQIGPMLDKVNTLLASVPADATRRVLDQLSTGLTDADADVGGTLVAASELVDAARADLEPTKRLIMAARPVLATQRSVAPQTRAYLHALAQVSGTLATSDGSLEAVLDAAPGTLNALRGFAGELAPVLPSVVGNATNAVAPISAYRENLEQTLVTYPFLMASLQSALSPRSAFGEVKLDLTGNFGNPGSCTTGYPSPSQRRSPTDSSTRPVTDDPYCQLGARDVRGVRGVRNAPCPNGVGRAATARGCGLVFAGATSTARRSFSSAALLDGAYLSGDGSAVQAPATVRPEQGEFPWISLITGPLGL